MTLPPERITVKRRRDEEPVDALYFPPHKSRRTFVWNRVPDEDADYGSQKSIPSAVDLPRIPTVRTTLPDEDYTQRPSASLPTSRQDVANEAPGDTTKPSHRTTESMQTFRIQDAALTHLLQEPRRFHLVRTSGTTRSPSVLHSGIQKSKKRHKVNLAIFVEHTDLCKKAEPRKTQITDFEGIQNAQGNGPPRSLAQPSSASKQPLASLPERAWRDQTWKQSSQKSNKEVPAARTEKILTATDSLQLASQLQKFALDVSSGKSEAQAVHTRTRTQIKPKPPRPRPFNAEAGETGDLRQGDVNAMDLSGTKDEEPDHFVFDVYVRHAEQVNQRASIGIQDTVLHSRDAGKVGVLVIADEDQETWELYGAEDQSSDEEWNSEEEDENAEGYYGNDYPEDELDSDDEYDRDTYKRWQGAFDEEDFVDDINWSDNEFGKKR
ncbi:MAG: hypothetical protein Q9207_004256 [Kuettlingeria erythrocarpa]